MKNYKEKYTIPKEFHDRKIVEQVKKIEKKNMNGLFEEIKINHDLLNLHCGWNFKYKGQEYANIVKTENVTKEIQIMVIKDMIKIMKRLHQ